MIPRAASTLAVFTLTLPIPARADVLPVPSPAHPTVQAAVDAARPGDRIHVAPGHYPEAVVVTTADVVLDGERSVIDAGGAEACVEVSADRVTLRGFRLVGGRNGVVVRGSGGVVTNNDVRGAAAAGIVVAGEDVTVTDNDVVGCGAEGIVVRAAAGSARVEQNKVVRCASSGIVATGGAFTILANEVRLCADGIRLAADHAAASEVTRNLVVQVRGTGVVARADGGPLRILTNTISAGGGAGIEVAHAGPAVVVLVEGNAVERVRGDGIVLDVPPSAGATIVENEVAHCEGDGIRSSGVALRLAENDVRHCRRNGIALRGRGHLVEENRVETCAAAGITVAPLARDGGLAQSTVRANEVSGAAADGIALSGDQLVVGGNRCERNGGAGIGLHAARDALLTRNVCRSNGGPGIVDEGIATLVEENECDDAPRSSSRTGAVVASRGRGER